MSYLQDLLGDAYKDGMSGEEISAALEKAGIGKADDTELEKQKAENKKLKETLSKKNSEAADYKKQYEAYLSEEEKKQIETQKKWDALEQENKQLKREKSIAEYTSQYIELGYDADLAKKTAEAMTDGDIKTVMENQKTFTQSIETKVRADIMRKNPDPVGGKSESTMTLENLRQMSMKDRYAFSVEHPEEYKRLYGQKEE